MKKTKHLYQDLKKKIEKLNRPCYIEGCDKHSTFNHLLQKNGILSQIEDDKHIYLLVYNNFYNPPILIEKKGVNKQFGFYGFCENHDNDLFKPIEGNFIDFKSYLHQLLFSLRTFYN